jgi:hypothetical protein
MEVKAEERRKKEDKKDDDAWLLFYKEKTKQIKEKFVNTIWAREQKGNNSGDSYHYRVLSQRFSKEDHEYVERTDPSSTKSPFSKFVALHNMEIK